MKRKYDLQNDAELNDASWEAGKGAMVGAATVCLFIYSHHIFGVLPLRISIPLLIRSLFCSSMSFVFLIPSILYASLFGAEPGEYQADTDGGSFPEEEYSNTAGNPQATCLHPLNFFWFALHGRIVKPH